MSDEYHVHGPHDHEVEHQGLHAKKHSFENQIAVTTAILATIGALFAYEGGATQANAMMMKDNASIAKTEASNEWNYYQAKNDRLALSELGLKLVPASQQEELKQNIQHYNQDKTAIKQKADQLEQQSDVWNHRSDQQMHLHHRWAQATTIIQVAISMAAISLLTRKRWLEWLMWGASSLGVLSGLMAFLGL